MNNSTTKVYGTYEKQVKVKEPVRLRFNELKDGRKSIYLDIYYNGRRTYQSLKLYLVPETDVSAQIQMPTHSQ